jgi:hypothetical protein
MQAITRDLYATLHQHVDVYHWLLRIEHYAGLGVGGFKLVGHWLHVPILCLVAAFVVYVVAYHLWCWRERSCLLDTTHYASTAHGFIEYRWYGSGPVVLVLHGTCSPTPLARCACMCVCVCAHARVSVDSQLVTVSQRTGTPGGSDQGGIWHQLLLGGEHFSVLAPSRFGYVGTRPGAGHCLTLAQQAEAISDLLHALNLTKVRTV